MRLSELAPYVGTGQGWDTQYESVLAGLLYLHYGFLSCCSICGQDNADSPSARAKKRLERSWEDDPVAEFSGVSGKERERARASHDDDIATAVLVDELMHEQRDAQSCCDGYDSDWPIMAAYKELVADVEKAARNISRQGPQKWRESGHPMPADMEEKFGTAQ